MKQNLSRRFEQALTFAVQLHAGQPRKGTDIPYVSHLLAVTSLALEHGADEDEAIAALLHDAVEDQGGKPTHEAIRRQFGERVARIVGDCTDARSLKPRDARLSLLLASAHHRAGNTLHAHFEYHNAVELGAADEPAIELGGAVISLRGIAAAGALATVDALAKSPEHRDARLKHVVELGRAGVTAFESVANRNVDRRMVKAMGERATLPPRLISGALNFYMAGQLAGIAMFLPERDNVLERTARKCDEQLVMLEGRRSVQMRLSDIAFLRQLVQAELRPLPAIA